MLKDALGAIWEGILESHGLDPKDGYTVVVGELHLEPSPTTLNGRAPVAEEGHP